MTNDMNSSKPSMSGKHILAELWDCECDSELLNKVEPLIKLLASEVDKVGLTMVGKAGYEFGSQKITNSKLIRTNIGVINPVENVVNVDVDDIEQKSGLTLSILLAESHICLHTWGEYKTVTLDIYVCNVTNENTSKADDLFAACLNIFKPKNHNVNNVSRHHGIQNKLKQ